MIDRIGEGCWVVPVVVMSTALRYDEALVPVFVIVILDCFGEWVRGCPIIIVVGSWSWAVPRCVLVLVFIVVNFCGGLNELE